MRNRRVRTIALVAAIAVLAAVGYWLLIVGDRYVPRRAARLVTPNAPAGFVKKPSISQQVVGSDNPLTTAKTAAKRSPHQTASWSVEWTRSGSSKDSISMLISVLPSTSSARAAQSEATRTYQSSTALKSTSYSYVGPFDVAAPAGASGSVFKPSSGTGPLIVVMDYQVGRAQVLEFAGLDGTAAQAEAQAETVARDEAAHLARSLPGIGFMQTTVPLVASLVWWGVAAVLCGLVVAVPIALRRRQERLRRAAERTRRRQVTSRGSKMLKRQSARSR